MTVGKTVWADEVGAGQVVDVNVPGQSFTIVAVRGK